MTTSQYDTMILYSANNFGANDAMDACTARAISNNANFFADGQAQVRVESAIVQDGVACPSTDWTLLQAFAFPLTNGVNNVPYKLRFRVGGLQTASGGTSTFRVVVGKWGRLREYVFEAGNNTKDFTTTSTSLSWLTVADNVMSVPQSVVDDMTVNAKTENDAGDIVNVKWPLAYLGIFGQSTSNKTLRVGPVYCAEFVG